MSDFEQCVACVGGTTDQCNAIRAEHNEPYAGKVCYENLAEFEAVVTHKCATVGKLHEIGCLKRSPDIILELAPEDDLPIIL